MFGNRFLDGLARGEQELLRPHLRRCFLPHRSVLTEQHARVQVIAFPVSAQIDNLLLQPDGSAVETAVVGAEGFTGLLPFLTAEGSAWRVEVRLEGDGYCIDADRMRAIYDDNAALRQAVARLAYFYQLQTSFNASCAATHAVMPRIARWLLTARDLTPSGDVVATQEEIAENLAVQRTSVVDAFSRLKAAGAIRHARGRIRILDLARLHGMACNCYDDVAAWKDSLLTPPSPVTTRARSAGG